MLKKSKIEISLIAENNEIREVVKKAKCSDKTSCHFLSQKFAIMLPKVKTFQVEKNKLRLDVPGWGWINLELYD